MASNVIMETIKQAIHFYMYFTIIMVAMLECKFDNMG